jgi:hypothetical protein
MFIIRAFSPARTREAALWVCTVAAAFAFSGALTGCGGPDQSTGTQVKESPVTEQQVKSMEEFYKTNPPGKAAKK